MFSSVAAALTPLNEAIAVTNNCGNCHAAEEAELLVAELNCCVTGHVAAQLFLVNCAVEVEGTLNSSLDGTVVVKGVQVACADVQCDELNIGVGVNCPILIAFAKA